MTVHREKRRVPYAAEEMFALVADVEQYPDFLPWCSELRVLERTKSGDEETLIADMTVSFKIHREKFRTRVTLRPDDRKINIEYIDGPFKYLQNDWSFEPDPRAGSVIHFHIDFEFKNRGLQMLIGFVFNEAVRRMIGAFEGRAKALYGRTKQSS